MMKKWVVYDSAYGNTEQIAWAIGSAFSSAEDVVVVRASEVKVEQLSEVKLLVVGSPTQKFRPLAGITNFLQSIPPNGLRGIKVVAFDTRLQESEIEKNRILVFFVKLFGYAAKPISNRLVKKGGELIAPPEGFYVKGMEGPLQEGELERAIAWAKHIMKLASTL
ncbi:nitric oxide synthase [candidate division KSB1 bacterium]|nr:flavodoxin-like domain-containing protein [candidate division KSB1 bacterium]RQW06921.1 MAG: nitric oxide synthase [candidate division KSB1 bacterium]